MTTMRFNSVDITEDTIRATREHFADNKRECMSLVRSGELRVNDVKKYLARTEEDIASILNGGWDHTFTFMQRAHWLQTGEDVPLFQR